MSTLLLIVPSHTLKILEHVKGPKVNFLLQLPRCGKITTHNNIVSVVIKKNVYYISVINSLLIILLDS